MNDVINCRPGWLGVLGCPMMWAQAPATLYIEELFAQAGLLNWRWIESLDASADESIRVLLIPNGRLLAKPDIKPLRQFLARGGCLLALGRPGPLDELFGIRSQPPVREGWLLPAPTITPAMSLAMPVPLHVFDVVHLLGPDGGELVGPLNFSLGAHHVNWPVSASVEMGEGRAMLIAADLAGSIVRIQQGLAIHHDGLPAPDGTAPINDGILKCDDSIMLEWTRDRQRPIDSLPPIFLQPQADLLRELLLAAIESLADHARMPLVRLDAWPRGLPAVGLISHDSDGNDQTLFARQFEADDQAGIAATWCCMSGTDDGRLSEYPAELLARIVASGHELALHYDAQSPQPECQWGQPTMRAQLARLRGRMRAVGIDAPVYSNKNHYTRWQGRLEFFRWLSAEGIRIDQSKAPTKTGGLGWPFGTCHPWRPIDDEISPPQLMDLLEIGFATQDLGLPICPRQFGRHYIDSAVARGGVAHLLFHPAHVEKPGVRDCLLDAAQYGREKGMEWWTSRQIGLWQFARRDAKLHEHQVRDGQLVLRLEAPRELESVGLSAAGARSDLLSLKGECEVRLGMA